MKLPWFRVYTELVDDEKLKLLAFEDRWHFIALLCIKGQGVLDKDEAPALTRRKVAVKLGLDLLTLDEVARRLDEVGLIDRATLQPAKWADRQMRSDTDPTAADRKRRQREREREEAANAEKANAAVAAADADVTDESRVTDVTVTRTDIDTEEEAEPSVKELDVVGGIAAAGAAPAAPQKPRRSEPKGTRLAADWALPKAWGEWALTERPDLTADGVRTEAECFRDYWHGKAGADARKADWLATWRNWVRRSKPAGRPARTPTTRPSSHMGLTGQNYSAGVNADGTFA